MADIDPFQKMREMLADPAWQDAVDTDHAPLSEVVERLRAIPGSEWKLIDDPYGEMMDLRGGGRGE